jgi:hypothetical protein
MNIGKTIDELDSFTGTPSLGSLFAIRDMSLPATDPSATKKFSISDFILLFQVAQNMYIARTTVSAGTSTKTFPIVFSTIPEVGILRVVDSNGAHISGNLGISNITTTGFTVDAIEDCTLTYFCGNVSTGVTTNPLAWLSATEGDVLEYINGQWTNRTTSQLFAQILSDLLPSSADDDVFQRKNGAWTNRTISELRSDIGPTMFLTQFVTTIQQGGSTTYFTFGSVSASASLGSPSSPSIVMSLPPGNWRLSNLTVIPSPNISVGSRTITATLFTTNTSNPFGTDTALVASGTFNTAIYNIFTDEVHTADVVGGVETTAHRIGIRVVISGTGGSNTGYNGIRFSIQLQRI